MKIVVHFAKVFSITSVLIAGVWLVAIMLGTNLVVAWYGTTRPSRRLIEMIFLFWPVALAFMIAALWEIPRAIRFRLVR
jgi:hypothetical protein